MENNFLDDSYRNQLKDKFKSAINSIISTDSRMLYKTNKIIIQNILDEIKTAYYDLFTTFHQSHIIVNYNNKEEIIYSEEIFFDTYYIENIYVLADTVYIKIVDINDDYWTEDIDINRIFALIDDYPKNLNIAKNKYLELLKNRVYYSEVRIEQYKKEFEEAKKMLNDYKIKYGLE